MRQWNRGRGCRWDGARWQYPEPRPVDDVDAQGNAYVGPCRCGRGPNAYYRTRDGRVVHVQDIARQTSSGADTEAMNAEIKLLTEEVRALKQRLGEE